MSEFHAAIAIESFARLDELLTQRLSFVRLYVETLTGVPGITFQRITKDSTSTYKDLGILIDAAQFGMDRNQLIDELAGEQIYTKKYFYPPLHRMKAYANVPHKAEGLSNTNYVADRIICLPLYNHMGVSTVERVCSAVVRASRKAKVARVEQ
jgi:dTDP-4-amino-4,6-dideoxygalactose transaminase